MEWAKLFYVIGAIALLGFMFWRIRSNPQMFSRENISRSFLSMGMLAIILIVVIALLVMWLRSA